MDTVDLFIKSELDLAELAQSAELPQSTIIIVNGTDECPDDSVLDNDSINIDSHINNSFVFNNNSNSNSNSSTTSQGQDRVPAHYAKRSGVYEHFTVNDTHTKYKCNHCEDGLKCSIVSADLKSGSTTNLWKHVRKYHKELICPEIITAEVITPEPVPTIEEKLVLIDTDAGTDDAWAMFMCLAAHQDRSHPFRVVGITCVTGNTVVDNVTVNVTRTLQTVGEPNIPVYRGSESALVFPWEIGEDPYNGHDGFGDAHLPPIQPKFEAEHAVNAIVQFAELYKGNLTILALGPLTNLAMAVRLQPQIKNWIKEVVILGGNYTGLGNTTALAEFNFLADPEAAHIVLENYGPECPVFIVPWETCAETYSTMIYRENILGNVKSTEMDLLNKIEARIIEKEKPRGVWSAPDSLAAAVLIENSITLQTGNYHCTVELSGKHSRGMMVVDKGFIGQKPSNCTIVEKVDFPLYEKMLMWAAGGPNYKTNGKKLPLPTRL